MSLRVYQFCAFGAFLLGFAAQPVRSQSDWPPEDGGQNNTAPPQQNYPSQPQQPGYPTPYPQLPYNQQAPVYGQQIQQPLNSDRLSQLVAPIALYPDSLVAQILTAATYPAQVSAADQWLHGMQGASPEQIAAAANAQPSWDPSIKALTAFPDVLAMLAQNLQWTSELGNAYYNQPQDVLASIQVLRQRAEQAGNLQTTPQEQITNDQGYVAIAPANPQVVYVPTYDPWMVYGQPIQPYPDYSYVGEMGYYIGTGIQYGIGVAMWPWLNLSFGLFSWGLDWLGNAVLFHGELCWTHSREMRDWGYRYGGPRWHGGYGYGRGGGYGHGGQQLARLGDYNHQPINVHGGSGGNNWYGRQGNYPAMRPGNALNSGGASRAYAGQLASHRMPVAGGRPLAYSGKPQAFTGQGVGRPAYGGQNFRGMRPTTGSYAGLNRGQTFARPGGGRPQGGAIRAGGGYGYSGGNGFGSRPGYSRMPASPSYGGSGHSSGYAMLGGGHAPSYGGGSHGFSGGGHSFGGGGHSFGGGSHSFGGGHSGGGHSIGGGHGHHGR